MRDQDNAPRAPSQPDLAASLDRQRLDWLGEIYDLSASYLVSAREAAWRGQSPDLVRGHADQARRALAEALEVEAALGQPEPVA